MIHSVVLLPNEVILFFFFFCLPTTDIQFFKKRGYRFDFCFWSSYETYFNSARKRWANICQCPHQSKWVQLISTTFKQLLYLWNLLQILTQGKEKKKYQSILFCLQGEFCSSARINGTIRFLIRPQCCNCCWTGFLVTCKWDFIKYRNRQICKHLQVLDPQDTRHHSFKQVCLPGQLLKISKLQAQDFILKYG